MKGLILCAGKGTRLRRLTESRPKPMLPIRGRPLLEHLIDWLRESGVREIAINLHHCPDVITEYFGAGWRHGVSITYSYEEELLGTAGAAKAFEFFLDQRFVVVYGDVMTNVDLKRVADYHISRRAEYGVVPAVTMVLYRVPDPSQCGVVELDEQGRVREFVEKPPAEKVSSDLAFSGVMICEPSILDSIPAVTAYDFGYDLLPLLLDRGIPLFGMDKLPDEYVIDIGTLPGYLRAIRMCSVTAGSQPCMRAADEAATEVSAL